MEPKSSFLEWVTLREAEGRSKSDLATDLGITVTSLYRYLSNDRVPDRTTMQRIIEVSDGVVDVACFYSNVVPDTLLNEAAV